MAERLGIYSAEQTANQVAALKAKILQKQNNNFPKIYKIIIEPYSLSIRHAF